MDRVYSQMMGALIRIAVCGACTFLATGQVRADQKEFKVKVAFIYNFLKFIEWPGDSMNSATEPIEICVIGTGPIPTMLNDLSIRKVQSRPIAITHIKDPQALPPCHLLYINRSEEVHLPTLLQRIQRTPVLTVSDMPRFAHKGGMIGFAIEENHVKIEISQKSVRQAGLKVRAKLLEIARLVP
ncbi:MAG: YfiR family protein [Deltaproteobacteria bacterium]|nr:YfiR family protein [Deltaproteobacteria bacterium]